MDDQGNIYDLDGQFIGVANPDEIEEMMDQEDQDDQFTDEVNDLLG